jgi:hypothetical protein
VSRLSRSRKFHEFLGLSTEEANPEDLRPYQLHLPSLCQLFPDKLGLHGAAV